MRIEGLRLKNFRCYDELEIDFEKNLTVIVGENGRGKTAIFDALTLALAPYLRAFDVHCRALAQSDVRRSPVYDAAGLRIESMRENFPTEISLELSADNEKFFSTLTMDADGKIFVNADTLAGLGEKFYSEQNKEIILPAFAYYGTSRIWNESSLLEDVGKNFSQRSIGYEDCLVPSSSYSSLGKWFREVTLQEKNNEQSAATAQNLIIRDEIRSAVNACLEGTGLKDLYYNFKLQAFVVAHPHTGEMLVENLSDGLRSVLSMVADLAYRMARLNPSLGKSVLSKTSGVVFVDEIDMHLHPSWQQTILLDMQRAFPQIQFVVTTHSPQVLSGVPAECIRVLSWGSGFDGVRRVGFSLGASTEQILQDIQNVGLRSERLPIVQKLKKYLELVSEDAWDSEEALRLREELDAWSGGNEPALVRADFDIRMRKLRRARR